MSESRLDQIVKGAPPTSIKLPPIAAPLVNISTASSSATPVDGNTPPNNSPTRSPPPLLPTPDLSEPPHPRILPASAVPATPLPAPAAYILPPLTVIMDRKLHLPPLPAAAGRRSRARRLRLLGR
ncbi:hypothetical protein GJ744_008015 [Endocarpon pusillum]|uniref:Uncharacterized protein n=1 Tax=Endocarpon pusillum TaxID=364733 RepID=A0A8H7AM47_9EURO|nr:hypothetical protein GJ744_008015 [Endocarpon pusillum]